MGNADGTWLGMTVAEQAANANGLRLTVSCSDTEFSAFIWFLHTC